MNRPAPPTDPGKLLEAALDVFVYAPIGLALDARDVVPKLAERGKNQVAMARLFGRYALRRGQVEADRLLACRSTPTPSTPPPTDPPPPVAAAPSATEPSATRPSKAARTSKTATQTGTRSAKRATEAPAQRAKAAKRATTARPPTLPIPGYDALSASQVVPRLDALRPAELEAVRSYEAEHRGRRTILNRIAQLQA